MRFSHASVALLVFVAGCDFSGDFLFPGAIEGVPGIIHLTAEDGGPMVPAVIESPEDARDATVYVELGPTGDANQSGLTLNFEGTGGSVCVFADPELIYWNQSVAAQGSAQTNRWRFPDNPYDDGDVDITAGLSVYYTGTEAEELGNFAVQYQDTLEETIPINLVACTITATVLGNQNPTAHSGRGAPEYCTVQNTQPGVSYTVAMEAFSLPPDDNRLMMGILLAEGGCSQVIEAGAPPDGASPVERMNEECLIIGEAIPPIEGEGQLYYGYEPGRSWEGSEAFEEHFCAENSMRGFCRDEVAAKEDAGLVCNYANPADIDEKCYCGDLRDTPTGGAF